MADRGGFFNVQESAGGATFTVKVTPRASQDEVVGIENGNIKIKLQAPPVDGAANEALVKFLAELFKKPKIYIEVIRGWKSRNKVVRIKGVNGLDVLTVFKKYTV